MKQTLLVLLLLCPLMLAQRFFLPNTSFYTKKETSSGTVASGIESIGSQIENLSENINDSMGALDDQLDASIKVSSISAVAMLDS